MTETKYIPFSELKEKCERIWCHCSNEHRKFLLEGEIEDEEI